MKKYNFDPREFIFILLTTITMLLLGSLAHTITAHAAEADNNIIVSKIHRRDGKKYFIVYKTGGNQYYITFFNEEDVTFSNYTTVIKMNGNMIEYGGTSNITTFKKFIYGGELGELKQSEGTYVEIRKSLMLASNCDFQAGSETYEQFEYRNGSTVLINKAYGMTAQEIWETTLLNTFGIITPVLTIVIALIGTRKGLAFIKQIVEVA